MMDPFSLFLIFTLIYEREALRVQRLTVFSENCCKGKSESYKGNVKNLDEESMILSKGQMRSFSIHRGLWSLSTGGNYTKSSVYYEGNNDDVNGYCGSSASGGSGDFIQYKSIRFIGNSVVDLAGLSLFTNEGFLGEELYFDGTNLRLPSPYVFKSYGFTGRDSWTIYPLTNFSGGPSCLIAQNKVVSFIYSNVTVPLGSLQRGCIKRSGKEKDGRKLSSSHRSKTLHLHQALILFLDENQSGEQLYTDALELRLPIPLNFKSHSFIGIKNWTIFTGTEHNGHSICLHNPKSTDGKSKLALEPMSVGSVRRGCESDPIREVITTPPETQDQQMETDGVRYHGYNLQLLLLSVFFQQYISTVLQKEFIN